LRNAVRLRAYAKINLGLKILGRRPDGYHDIRTVYQTVALHDRLEVSVRGGKSETLVECDDPAVPGGPANLVHQACTSWRQRRRYRGGIKVRLEKRIPMGSGLGGASSDAAAVLLGLERLTGDRLAASERLSLAAHLGSDVPFFLLGGRVLGCGRGDELYPLRDLPRRSCLIVFPGFAVSTGDAYQQVSARLTAKPDAPTMKRFGAWPYLAQEEWVPAENDFEMVVFARWPRLARLKRQLIRAGAEAASLTGSGSALYAVFPSAQQLANALQHVPAGWEVLRTRTLQRPEYWQSLFET